MGCKTLLYLSTNRRSIVCENKQQENDWLGMNAQIAQTFLSSSSKIEIIFFGKKDNVGSTCNVIYHAGQSKRVQKKCFKVQSALLLKEPYCLQILSSYCKILCKVKVFSFLACFWICYGWIPLISYL